MLMVYQVLQILDVNYTQSGALNYNTQSIGARLRNVQMLYSEGKIDQVRIFNRAITANEVTTLYNEVECIPTIVPTDYFNTVIWSGNGSTDRQITNLGFAPDWVWVKERNPEGLSHNMYDTIRGAGLRLISNLNIAETTLTEGVKSFDLNGFTVGDAIAVNRSGSNFVAWNWKAGGPDVLNTDGTITSQVSANTEAGFSIVKITNKVTSPPVTIGHGLNSAPELIIWKFLTAAVDWNVYHSSIGATKSIVLNSTAAEYSTTLWNNTAPTNSVFSVSQSSNSHSYIAYCFHSVDGYSKIGSYVGTNAPGNSIVTGFRPAFLMTKRSSAAGGGWNIFDNKRETDKRLYPNLSNAEGVDNPEIVTFNSNGFTFNTADSWNNGAYTYIFMAFAEEVFVPDNFFNDDSTVATYKLDGDAGDDSGNGYNGVATNVTYAAGKFDEAAVFNGSSSSIQICKD